MGLFFEEDHRKKYTKSKLFMITQGLLLTAMIVIVIVSIIYSEHNFMGIAPILASVSIMMDAIHYHRHTNEWNKKEVIIVFIFFLSGVTLLIS
ncbi:hypothetical protein [Gracilibacillus kekensis]|uniref:Uncharacterized protein n=1 Tax=Gracilibacillus kekensis TaxID=1027249 RepID=A0A1M7PYR4_9BACI|nr:hypothetical protein [Gracilibacillus kekensis]SHN22799.1 hypothetical protein SAMN05216179_2600 [Gracilibacillus kekensis]